jgi:hypothetical protein
MQKIRKRKNILISYLRRLHLPFFVSVTGIELHHKTVWLFFSVGYSTTLSVAKIIERRWHVNERVWRNGGMIVTREKEALGEKPVPLSLYPPQIPYRLAWD